MGLGAAVSKLNRTDKERLAFLVMSRVADIVEFWGESGITPSDLAHLSAVEVQAQLATWMSKLPGNLWDERLGDVADLVRASVPA